MKNPEWDAAQRIEALLRAAGWTFDSEAQRAVAGVVKRDFRVGSLTLDYALFTGDRLVGIVEVKRRMSGAAVEQSRELGERVSPDRPPVIYISTGREIVVLTAPNAPPREVATFHTPEGLASRKVMAGVASEIGALPPLPSGLRPEHADAIRALEASLEAGERRALLAVPTGGGRTNLLVAETERLLRHTSVRRVLVLVDRLAVADQTRQGLRNYEADGRSLGGDYRVEVADSPQLALSSNVVVMTVQRLVSLLGRQTEQRHLPVEFFDFLWALDPERLTGSRWEVALDYFDAPLVGVTQSPTPETYAFFDGNLVAEFDVSRLIQDSHRRPDESTLDQVIRRANLYRDMPTQDAVLRVLREGAVALRWRELTVLFERLGPKGPSTPAEFVLDFISDYFAGREAEWAVDPAVTSPALLAAVVEAGAANKAVGFVVDRVALNFAEGLRADPRVTWVEENLLRDAPRQLADLGTPSVIVSAPPLGVRAPSGPLYLPDGRVLDVSDDAAHRLLLQAAAELDDEGEAVFLVGDGFFRADRGNVRTLLGDAGLHVHAVIAVREGFAGIHAPLSLVFIRRQPSEDVFVGELSPTSDRSQLLSHLQRRRRGPVPALGRLVPWEGFESFARVAADERVEALLVEAPGEVRPLDGLLAGPIHRPRKGEDFEPAANAVYVPTFASSVVHASRDELTSKPWGYFQVPLDPKKALAEYVAAMLNNPAGGALRESIAGGTVRPSISRTALSQLRIPLPDVEAQQEIVSLQTRIRALRLELDGLERRLSNDADNAGDVRTALEELGYRDPLTTFREALPFPLASILWRYEADADARDKVAHLHGFFEACAIYFATVLLSAFATDGELYREEKRRWFSKLKRNSFDISSFGTWTLFGRLMTKSARKLLDDEQQRQRMVDAFAVSSERFSDAVASHQLWDLLDEAKDTRNKEKAHGGIAGPEQHASTHARLSALLTKLGTLVGPCLGDVLLVRPGVGRHRRGVTYYDRAEVLQGRDAIFRQQPLATLVKQPLEDTELYLFPSTANPAETVLHIEPFVRLKAPPRAAQNACYFYAELRGGEVQFVSHHFEGAPRIQEPDEDVVQLITQLQAVENGDGA